MREERNLVTVRAREVLAGEIGYMMIMGESGRYLCEACFETVLRALHSAACDRSQNRATVRLCERCPGEELMDTLSRRHAAVISFLAAIQNWRCAPIAMCLSTGTTQRHAGFSSAQA